MTGRQDANNTDIWPLLASGIKATCKPKIHSETHNIQPTLNGLKRGDAGEVILNLFFFFSKSSGTKRFVSTTSTMLVGATVQAILPRLCGRRVSSLA